MVDPVMLSVKQGHGQVEKFKGRRSQVHKT